MSMTSPEPEMKPEIQCETSEYKPPTSPRPQNAGVRRVVESVGLGLTALALLSSITIIGTAGDTLSTYNKTTLSSDFPLSLWPRDFDLRPTVALVACSAIITLSSIAFLVATKVPAIQKNHLVVASTAYLAPTVSLVASLIATSFFYGVNASRTTSSLQSWSCQWSSIDMSVQPHWSTLCRESKAALFLMVMMVPLQVLVIGTVVYAALALKKQSAQPEERKASPDMA